MNKLFWSVMISVYFLLGIFQIALGGQTDRWFPGVLFIMIGIILTIHYFQEKKISKLQDELDDLKIQMGQSISRKVRRIYQ